MDKHNYYCYGVQLMNVAAYCRVSTDKTDQLNSLETQKKFFSDYTEKNGHRLVRLYADEGISGTKIKNRIEFQALLRDAQRGHFDMVVVKDISRFARNTVDLLQSIRTLKALGIETTFLTSNMSVLGQSEFVLTIFGALAQEESANTSKRIKFGKQLNAGKGRVPNLVYGYEKTAGDYFSLKIDTREADIIRRIYSWYVDDGYGAAKISNLLNSRGIKTKRGCAWSQNAVCRILSNELYTGKIINGKQEISDFLTGARAEKAECDWFVTENPALGIITRSMFERAGHIMSERGRAFKVDRQRHSGSHLYSTLIKCGGCGRSFRRTVREYKNTFVRWICSGHSGQGALNCPNAVAVDEDDLIAALSTYFSEILLSKKQVMKHAAAEFERAYYSRSGNQSDENELRAALGKLEKSRRKYMDMYADDLITRGELNEKISGMCSETARLERELTALKGRGTDIGTLADIISRTFGTAHDIADVRRLTNAQLKKIVQKIEVDAHGNVDIYLRDLNVSSAG